MIHHWQVLRPVVPVVQRDDASGGECRVQIHAGVRQIFRDLVPVPPAPHVGQDKAEGADLIHDAPAHPGRAANFSGIPDVQSRVGDDDKIQLRGALDDPEKFRAVDLRPLVHRVDLDAFQTKIFDPGKFRPEIRMIRVE